jgi:hypothetical protein
VPLIVPPLDPIWSDRDALRDLFDFRTDYLGEKVLNASTRAIDANCSQQLDPNDMPWPALGQWYAEWKSRVAPGKPIGVLWGVMLSWSELLGRRRITKYTAVHAYGVSPLARYEAVAFQEPHLVGRPGQPPRPFYAVSPSRIGEVHRVFDDYFAGWTLP